MDLKAILNLVPATSLLARPQPGINCFDKASFFLEEKPNRGIAVPDMVKEIPSPLSVKAMVLPSGIATIWVGSLEFI